MRPIRVLLAASAAVLVAAGCGDDASSDPAAGTAAAPTSSAASAAGGGELAALPPEQILAKAKAAIKAADSVRLKGGGATEGQTFTVDMRYSADKAFGTVGNAGQVVELRRIGTVVYLKADKAFWTSTAGAAAAELLAGKYLKAPLTDQRVAQLATFTDKNAFVDQALAGSGTLTKGDTKDVRGTPAIGLVNKASNGTGTLYVATTGEPYPLQLVPESGGSDSGSLDFLDYGKPVTVEVPPAAQTIDVSKLGGS